ncbi:ead/Ea22-like family protein [Klebsiella pneumoniae]|uniref:ead/Ea22-like family protein n=1 Tax=Klebsiella pneumoniae TaxID=573 RepID=UPI0021E6E15B|nr:ead/Ea22-like family protein [Klebsiella pneumoniae]
MTTDITELAQSLKAAAEKATQGEWWADEVKNEGCYGSGDDCVEGFTSYAIYGSDGQTLFDSLNSDAACISEEYDGEGHVAWDETAQRNAEFIALANPANILALVEALEKAQQRITQLESSTITIKFTPIPVEELGNVRDGKKHPYMFGAGYNAAVIHCESVIQQELDAKGIKWEAE